MILTLPLIDNIIKCEKEKVCTIVIENSKLFYDLVNDIFNQINGFSGTSVLSENDKILDFSKNAEIISSFFPFEINQKNLLSKISSAIEKKALCGENYDKTMSILSQTEKYMNDIVADFDCNLTYSKMVISSIIKAVGIEIVDDYTNLSEKIIDYMELTREFDRDKLFISVNLRSFIDKDSAENFMKTISIHGFNLVMIENKEYDKCNHESRVIVDSDLCLIDG